MPLIVAFSVNRTHLQQVFLLFHSDYTNFYYFCVQNLTIPKKKSRITTKNAARKYTNQSWAFRITLW